MPCSVVNIRRIGGVDAVSFRIGGCDARLSLLNGVSASAAPNDVNFLDYDGIIRYSYTKEEFLTLTKLPENPSHDGLIAQGWNWTLADAKEQVQSAGWVDIGQNYTTDNGTTRLYVTLEKDTTITLKWWQTVTNGVTIDWGDGSATYKQAGTQVRTATHSYAAGSYVITFTVTSGQLYIGGNSATQAIHGDATTDFLKRVELGANAGLKGYAFYACKGLRSVSIPTTLLELGAGAFMYAVSLQGATIPDGVTNIQTQTFRDCGVSYSSLPVSVTTLNNFNFSYGATKRVNLGKNFTTFGGTNIFYYNTGTTDIYIPGSVSAIPNNLFYVPMALKTCKLSEGITTIGNVFCYNAYTLQKVTIPSTITSIGTNAFTSCSLLTEIHMKPTTPPTIQSNTFGSLQASCVIYVPSGSLSAYQSATNWSNFASKMVEE